MSQPRIYILRLNANSRSFSHFLSVRTIQLF
nr:MAG TPA: MIF4G like [Caudoviricetes sp.]